MREAEVGSGDLAGLLHVNVGEMLAYHREIGLLGDLAFALRVERAEERLAAVEGALGVGFAGLARALERGAGIAQSVVERGVALPVGIEPDDVAIGPVAPELRRVAGLGERADRTHQGEGEEKRKATASERHEETSFL